MSINDTVEQSLPPLSMDWSYALGGPVGHCLFKQKPEDFCVDEELPFEPEGEGEHLYLLIEKKGENTDWVAGLLARHAGVRRQAVSYAGRKDRQGVTRQWFCLSLPGQPDPDWQGFQSDTVQILQQARHRKKLRTGALKSNRFTIRLREVEVGREEVEQRLNQIFQQGVPNYYGEQRFGHEGRNVDRALAMFSGRFRVQRNKRSVYLSAARSWLFNQVISERVDRGLWRNYLAGDVLGFRDSNSLIFDALDESLSSRLEAGDLSPTAPLWGRGLPKVSDQALSLEQSVARCSPSLCEGLEQAGLQQERRVTRVIPENMSWEWDERSLLIRFRLPKGCFATSVLRELMVFREVAEDGSASVQ